MTEAEAPQVPVEQKQDKPPVKLTFEQQILKDMNGEQRKAVEAFKSQGVGVNVIPIAGEYYLYRTIKRSEWRELQHDQAQRAAASEENTTQQQLQGMWEEAVVFRCSLFPQIRPENYMQFDAGVISTMHDAILFSSGFNQETVPVKL